MTMTSDETRRFLLHGTRPAKAATVMPDGTPRAAPAWSVLDGEQVVFTAGADPAKGRNLRRDPRAVPAADDEEPPYAFVHLRGVATISSDPSELRRFATEIGARHMAKDRAGKSGRRNAARGELVVRITPQPVIAQNDIAGH